jgi:polyisoprenoid-binding protein YceI
MRSLAAAALAGLLALPMAAHAAPWTFDPSHSAIVFEVDHLGFSTTHGMFRAFRVELDLDEASPARSKVAVTIDAASIDTNWEKRDEHLRSADFLDVATHPTITFTSTSVEPTGASTAKVTGDLTINGRTRPVTLDVVLRQLAPHPFTQTRTAGFSATTTIKRSDFGIETYLPLVGDEIAIQIALEAQPES